MVQDDNVDANYRYCSVTMTIIIMDAKMMTVMIIIINVLVTTVDSA